MLAIDGFRALYPGESKHLEFKQGLTRSGIQEAVTAFSNTDGGVLVAGVTDDGTPIGLTVSGDTESDLHRTVSGVRDPGRYRIHNLIVGDLQLLAISVQPRVEGFAQLSSGAVLVRRGASNVKLFGEELATFLSERKLSRFETTATTAAADKIASHLLDDLADAYNWNGDVDDRLKEIGFVAIVDGKPRLTVAGCAFLLDDPAPVLGKAFIEYFRFPENDGPYDRRVEIVGPVNRQVEQATEFLSEELGVQVAVVGAVRHELPKVPHEVLREALANAVAHRQYETNHTPVRISHYPDRLVIESPGLLPEPVTVDSIRHQNAARNPSIIGTLRRFKLAEDAGMGVDLMQDRMKAHMLVAPRFEETTSSFRVSLVTASAVSNEERAWIADVVSRGRIEPDDRAVLLHAARGEQLTNKYVRELFGLDSTEARSVLQRLRDAGLLTQRGERKATTYVIAENLGRSVPRALTPEELEELLLELAVEGPLTNALVREHTGLGRAAVTRLLQRMVMVGALEQRGDRRGTVYVVPNNQDPLPLD